MIDFTLSRKLKTNYQTSFPFPYIVIDDFFSYYRLSQCLEELKKNNHWSTNQAEWMNEFSVKKFWLPDEEEDISIVKSKVPITTSVIEYLTSPKFIKYLEELTGIKNLQKDPMLLGGGIHKINSGGHLSIHKDYNTNHKSGKRRKLNLLLYLNKDWDKSWGGNLELWNKNLTHKIVEVEPIFNRAVIFNIDDAPHGHPHPLNCPEDRSRYSLALYYFIDENDDKKTQVEFFDHNLLSEKHYEINIEDITLNKSKNTTFKY